MRYRELAKQLRSFGCHEVQRRSGGSHRKWLNPESGKGTVIPDWGDTDLKQHQTIFFVP
ncbi:MAG: type II toxin-antitoxin system HicA family toxin [Methanosarcinales archaeon]|nr:MAG: type II toxin-antitoxin system HicA family toxin [Methanosarcinales archaeon]